MTSHTKNEIYYKYPGKQKKWKSIEKMCCIPCAIRSLCASLCVCVYVVPVANARFFEFIFMRFHFILYLHSFELDPDDLFECRHREWKQQRLFLYTLFAMLVLRSCRDHLWRHRSAKKMKKEEKKENDYDYSVCRETINQC